jgi:hypothetical protein
MCLRIAGASRTLYFVFILSCMCCTFAGAIWTVHVEFVLSCMCRCCCCCCFAVDVHTCVIHYQWRPRRSCFTEFLQMVHLIILNDSYTKSPRFSSFTLNNRLHLLRFLLPLENHPKTVDASTVRCLFSGLATG